MGAYKGLEARYNVVSARVTDRERHDLQVFADERKIEIGTAARMLMAIGLETMNGGKQNG